ncbi:MAG: hypothetical protein KME50_18340 [Nostoc desertorum CM1-VF14]|nr:hypothetical protein [Nostoc desertorum CM1-VF14]
MIRQILPLTSQPEGAIKAQQLISKFSQSQDALKFYQFAHELTDFAKTVQERQEEADVAQEKAALMQAQIIIGSMLLSVAIAAILAFYTSRIMVQNLCWLCPHFDPLTKALTSTSQKSSKVEIRSVQVRAMQAQ